MGSALHLVVELCASGGWGLFRMMVSCPLFARADLVFVLCVVAVLVDAAAGHCESLPVPVEAAAGHPGQQLSAAAAASSITSSISIARIWGPRVFVCEVGSVGVNRQSGSWWWQLGFVAGVAAQTNVTVQYIHGLLSVVLVGFICVYFRHHLMVAKVNSVHVCVTVAQKVTLPLTKSEAIWPIWRH